MIIKNINVSKLHAELVANNIHPYPVEILNDSSGDFTFTDDVDMTLVQSIIDAHDNSPILPQKTESEILHDENEQLKNSLADLWEVVLLGGAE